MTLLKRIRKTKLYSRSMKNISANLGRISDDYFFRENLYKYSFGIKQTF